MNSLGSMAMVGGGRNQSAQLDFNLNLIKKTENNIE
jgi:hypothetical protein